MSGVDFRGAFVAEEGGDESAVGGDGMLKTPEKEDCKGDIEEKGDGVDASFEVARVRVEGG